nr:short-chain dehydrogenase/reductase trope [Quercus suber]
MDFDAILSGGKNPLRHGSMSSYSNILESYSPNQSLSKAMAAKQVVLITGANTGLGLEVVRALYKSSTAYEILLGCRSLEKGESAVATVKQEISESSSTISTIQVDVASDSSIEAAIDKISSTTGKLDVLINNAGANFENEYRDGKLSLREAWNQSWDTNVAGTQVITSLAVPLMLKSSNPRLMFLTSGTASIAETESKATPVLARINSPPEAGWPKPKSVNPIDAYRSAKAGLNMMMRTWHQTLGNDGVKVWAISPGFLATGLNNIGTDALKKMGALEPSAGADFIREVIEGKRDQDVGKAIRANMIQPCLVITEKVVELEPRQSASFAETLFRSVEQDRIAMQRRPFRDGPESIDLMVHGVNQCEHSVRREVVFIVLFDRGQAVIDRVGIGTLLSMRSNPRRRYDRHIGSPLAEAPVRRDAVQRKHAIFTLRRYTFLTRGISRAETITNHLKIRILFNYFTYYLLGETPPTRGCRLVDPVMAIIESAGIPQPARGPYRPQEQALGQVPSVLPDVPVCAVFLLIFLAAGAGHMILLKRNQKRDKKFVINGMIFGFCFTRIMANIFRITWACYPRNVSLGIVATLFVYAGIVLLFIGNLFFAQRIVRSQHPHVGWSTPFSLALPALMVIIICTVLALIVGVIYSFFTLNHSVLHHVRNLQLYALTLFTIVTIIPVPTVLLSAAGRRLPGAGSVDKFGEGRMRTKIFIVVLSGLLLTLGAAYRAATSYLPPTPTQGTQPWYFSKASFFVFDFAIEAFIVVFWLLIRIDKRFYIPDGAKGPFSYGDGYTFAGERGNEKKALGNRDSMRDLVGSSSTTNVHRTPSSRWSYADSRRSQNVRDSWVSWGGLSTVDITDTLAEDGGRRSPYAGYTGQAQDQRQEEQELMQMSAADIGVDGAEAEMGWDRKSGKWALRPLSTAASQQQLLTRPAASYTSLRGAS